MATTVRWIQSSGPEKPAAVRDQHFETKNEALDAISKINVSSIKKLQDGNGRLYVVQVASRDRDK